VSRTTTLVLVALGAALAGFAFSSAAERLRNDSGQEPASAAAGPQRADLHWRETLGTGRERLVFVVESLEVVSGGWRVRVSLENDTSVAYGLGDPRATIDRSFGLMLFSSGDIAELERLNASGELPALRRAVRYEPELPAILEPRSSWTGVISAPGALVAGSWVRVVLGALVAVGKTPEGLPERVIWITDHAYRLRP
jgi:hypothetical protein